MMSTADVYDERGEQVASCETQLRSFGARTRFTGVVSTIRCLNDNGLVKQVLTGTDGRGRVLVVDGGGSLGSALMGDMIAAAAVRNGWEGVVINGPVRDSDALAGLDLGIKALGTNPRTSAKDAAGDVDAPVTFGGATFVAGRRLWADVDGVLVER
ncbi:MAG: ribonuclease E activity regulator RraA [Actinomycetes bacterium]